MTTVYYKEVIVNKQNGYILIVTLLMMVALTVAGMGAMMVATSDVNLSGNQRTQVAAREASGTGINAGMATLCSNSFLTASRYVGNTINGPMNTPPSSPPAGFYTGLYSSLAPTTNAGSNYAAGYFTPSSSPSSTRQGFGAAVPPPIGSYGSRSAVNTWSDLGTGKGMVYRIGPEIGVVGTSTKMECEQFVYYGLP
jgi:Tfp pilus assembly protein PilX